LRDHVGHFAQEATPELWVTSLWVDLVLGVANNELAYVHARQLKHQCELLECSLVGADVQWDHDLARGQVRHHIICDATFIGHGVHGLVIGLNLLVSHDQPPKSEVLLSEVVLMSTPAGPVSIVPPPPPLASRDAPDMIAATSGVFWLARLIA
jgi:hypothetical protein